MKTTTDDQTPSSNSPSGGSPSETPTANHAVQPATEGAGPLLQRDYWAIIEQSALNPEETIDMVRTHFSTFAPKEMVQFYTPDDAARKLEVGQDMKLDMLLIGVSAVRLVHLDARSLTLRTLEGHPEAGRITFGAQADEQGRLVFRIRSRARAGGPLHLVGFTMGGKAFQTRIWKTFIQRVAAACNGTILGEVREQTREAQDTVADEGALDTPTFVATGEFREAQQESS